MACLKTVERLCQSCGRGKVNYFRPAFPISYWYQRFHLVSLTVNHLSNSICVTIVTAKINCVIIEDNPICFMLPYLETTYCIQSPELGCSSSQILASVAVRLLLEINMKYVVFLLVVAFFSDAFGINTVSTLNVTKYLGRWYQVRRANLKYCIVCILRLVLLVMQQTLFVYTVLGMQCFRPQKPCYRDIEVPFYYLKKNALKIYQSNNV